MKFGCKMLRLSFFFFFELGTGGLEGGSGDDSSGGGERWIAEGLFGAGKWRFERHGSDFEGFGFEFLFLHRPP